MYEDFYGLAEPPFRITPDPRYLFFSRRHREAHEHVMFGITRRVGFIQLTGEVGAGKTTLCRRLLEVRLLSNLETDDRKLLQIVLIGQPELREALERPALRQLRQRARGPGGARIGVLRGRARPSI